MSRSYHVIDSDGHVLEPPDLWARYIDPAYRDRAPVFTTEDGGAEHLRVETAVWSLPQGFGGTGSYGAPRTEGPLPYTSGRRGGFDPDARIVDMDAEGVDASFSFPTLGLFLSGRIQDPGLGAAVCRAYNRWLADYCAAHPDRLFGLAMLPLQSVDVAVAELEYARRELGFGGSLHPGQPRRRTLHPRPRERRDLGGRAGDGRVDGDPRRRRRSRPWGRPLQDARRGPRRVAHPGDDGRLRRTPHVRRLRAVPQAPLCVHGVGRRLDRGLARPHGPSLRARIVERRSDLAEAQRNLRTAGLDILRAHRR